MSQTCQRCYKVVARACQGDAETLTCRNLQRAETVQARADFSRPVVIHICKDGTISYRAKGQPVFNGRAMPVFSVDTIQQAEDAQVMFGRKQWAEHPQLPGRPWYRWTDFSGEVEALDEVTVKLREWFNKFHRKTTREQS